MSRPFLWLVVALAAAPARLKELGYLDPPVDRQHELRRTISAAVYASLLFLPVLVYGFGKGWPTAWILFGVLDGAALLFFAGSGLWAARELWNIRHPGPAMPAAGLEATAATSPPHDARLEAAPLAPPATADSGDDEPAPPPAGG